MTNHRHRPLRLPPVKAEMRVPEVSGSDASQDGTSIGVAGLGFSGSGRRRRIPQLHPVYRAAARAPIFLPAAAQPAGRRRLSPRRQCLLHRIRKRQLFSSKSEYGRTGSSRRGSPQGARRIAGRHGAGAMGSAGMQNGDIGTTRPMQRAAERTAHWRSRWEAVPP